ncbi:hypothetical protein PENDEC_c002G07092 [Penicillium decumbens]|uniref:Uncharacterized protein n=1 Tax=Penicillium decumbens TaxID=69771 RepID=A0A1V6PM07_PENDC|nr:hypothetical protein PENDEC_c002G07092 [Penicillium decumbens]
MLRAKSPDLEGGDYECRGGLLTEEQSQLWTQDEEIGTCSDWAAILLQVTTLGIFFFLGYYLGLCGKVIRIAIAANMSLNTPRW